MLFSFSLLLILFCITLEDIEYEDFPLNYEFNILKEEKEKNIINIYLGNIMTFLKIRTNDKKRTSYLSNLDNIIFDFKFSNITDLNRKNCIRLCRNCLCNETESNYPYYNESNCSEPNCNYTECNLTCIEELSVGYGKFFFIRIVHITPLLIFFGTFMIFFGRNHYIFAAYFEFAEFLNLFISDFIELFSSFENNVTPFYILGGSVISGFVMVFVGKAGEKQLLLFDIFKVILGSMIGYFFIKPILYYLSIFVPINNILYAFVIIVFVLLGGIVELFLKNKLKNEQILFLICSILAGSMLIVKGVSFTLGGYFSDTMTSQLGLKYEFDAKLRVFYFFIFHLVIIGSSLFYQIKDYKNSIYEDSLSRASMGSVNFSYITNKSGKNSNINKDINTSENEEETMKNMSLKDSLPDSSKEGKIIPDENEENGENGENGEINDKDD